jgi:hypothetical protein
MGAIPSFSFADIGVGVRCYSTEVCAGLFLISNAPNYHPGDKNNSNSQAINKKMLYISL